MSLPEVCPLSNMGEHNSFSHEKEYSSGNTVLGLSLMSLQSDEWSETTAHGQELPGHLCQISFIFTGPAQQIHHSQSSTTDGQDCPTLCTAGSWNQTTIATNDASRRVLLHLLFTPFSAVEVHEEDF